MNINGYEIDENIYNLDKIHKIYSNNKNFVFNPNLVNNINYSPLFEISENISFNDNNDNYLTVTLGYFDLCNSSEPDYIEQLDAVYKILKSQKSKEYLDLWIKAYNMISNLRLNEFNIWHTYINNKH